MAVGPGRRFRGTGSPVRPVAWPSLGRRGERRPGSSRRRWCGPRRRSCRRRTCRRPARPGSACRSTTFEYFESWYQELKSSALVVIDCVVSTSGLYCGSRSAPSVSRTMSVTTRADRRGNLEVRMRRRIGESWRSAGSCRGRDGDRAWWSPRPLAQSQPGSSLQSDEQPSPDFWLPSSHSSSGSLRPSPHGEVQPSLPVHMGSALQSVVQPSPGRVLPSSHDSPPSLDVVAAHRLVAGLAGVGQAYPASTLHVAEHPSCRRCCRRRTASPPVRRPSPHLGWQRMPGAGHDQPGSTGDSSRNTRHRSRCCDRRRPRCQRRYRPRTRRSRCRGNRV